MCAGIAAYKAVELCRRLTESGHHVVVVLTEDAKRFVGEMTFAALASELVPSTLWDPQAALAHTRLAARLDAAVVVPATADFLAKMAHGLAGDTLSATVLATVAPVVVAPAMHSGMWENPATRDNVALLAARGVSVVPPGVGPLAGGDSGVGRLAEIGDIVAALESSLERRRDMEGLSVLVTAGGTREPIDPVRFIGNRSSGKQGHALAVEARARGAQVTLVTAAPLSAGPSLSAGPLRAGGAEIVSVETATEMADAVLSRVDQADVVIMAAAVADFRPEDPAKVKHRKSDGPPVLTLVPTRDILAEIGARRSRRQVVVGFAAETGDPRDRARSKLAAKGADIIVANDVTSAGAGFEHDTNAVWILEGDGTETEIPLTGKDKVAQAVLDAVLRRLRDSAR